MFRNKISIIPAIQVIMNDKHAWFQQDDATPYYVRVVRNYLNIVFLYE